MKRLLILFLALVMLLGILTGLLGILAGYGVTTKAQTETVQSTTETTAPAEASTPTETSTTNGEAVENTLPITPSQFLIGGILLDLPGSGDLFDCGGEMIRPLPSNLKDIEDDIAILMCNNMHIILKDSPCKVEDFQQAGVNFAYLLVNMSDSVALPTLKETARECFGIAKETYSMDQVYPWVFVGLACPEITIEYFSGEFSESPDKQIIEQVQKWIPHILYLQESSELADAIKQNPWFELEYLAEP